MSKNLAKHEISWRHASWVPVLVFVSALSVYVRTLYPTVAAGDSAELTTIALKLGVAHPPGYPLYTLLAHVFSYLPLGTPAWRINLFSAVCSALSLALLSFAIPRAVGCRNPGRAISGAFMLLLGFAPLYWRYSINAEVFAFNHLLLALAIVLLVEFGRAPRRRLALACAFVLGIGVSHQQTFVFFAIPAAVWLLWRTREMRGALWQIVLGGLLGLVPYLYLPLAATRTIDLSWGQVQTWHGFLAHVLRREYGTFQLGQSSQVGRFWPSLFAQISNLPQDFGILALVLGAIGLAAALWMAGRTHRAARGWVFVLCISVVTYELAFHALAGFSPDDPVLFAVLQRFWLQPTFLAAFVSGVGCVWLFERVRRRRLQLTILAIIALAVGGVMASNLAAIDQHENWSYHRFGERLLLPLPENAVFLPYGDLDFFLVSYLQACEGLRPDVAIISQGRVRAEWYRQAAEQRLQNHQGTRNWRLPQAGSEWLATFLITNPEALKVDLGVARVFTSSRNPEEGEAWKVIARSWPLGFVDGFWPVMLAPETHRYLQDSSAAWGDFSWLDSRPENRAGWVAHIAHRFAWSEYRRAELLLDHPATAQSPEAIATALQILQILQQAHPENHEISQRLLLAQDRQHEAEKK